MIDPDGMLDWHPVVNEDKTVSYIAEKGDNVKTFAEQYGLTISTAKKIISKPYVKEGTEITGAQVEKYTGSDVLKLDLNSKMATDQRIVDQLSFGIHNSLANNKNGFYTIQYFGNVYKQHHTQRTIVLGSGNQKFRYILPLYETSNYTRKGATLRSFYISNTPYYTTYGNGNYSGSFQDLEHLHFALYLNYDGELKRYTDDMVVSKPVNSPQLSKPPKLE